MFRRRQESHPLCISSLHDYKVRHIVGQIFKSSSIFAEKKYKFATSIHIYILSFLIFLLFVFFMQISSIVSNRYSYERDDRSRINIDANCETQLFLSFLFSLSFRDQDLLRGVLSKKKNARAMKMHNPRPNTVMLVQIHRRASNRPVKQVGHPLRVISPLPLEKDRSTALMGYEINLEGEDTSEVLTL